MGYDGYVAVGVVVVERRAGDVRRIPAVCRRRLTLRRLKPWAAARETAVTPSRYAVIRSAMSRSSRRSRRLHGRVALGLGAHAGLAVNGTRKLDLAHFP
jgi:hypothetical protein